MNRLVFGEADPADYTPPVSAPPQTNDPERMEVALRATLHVGLARYPRARCASCLRRRVRYAITVNGYPMTAYLCALCAGVR